MCSLLTARGSKFGDILALISPAESAWNVVCPGPGDLENSAVKGYYKISHIPWRRPGARLA
jgi:hypothetical protein